MQARIYSRGANVVIAAQFGRPMQATPAQGGYRITGCAPFVSNCHDAHWIATTAAVMAGDPSPAAGALEVVMAYLPREKLPRDRHLARPGHARHGQS